MPAQGVHSCMTTHEADHSRAHGRRQAAWALLLGLAAFVVVTGGRIVFPGNTAWLMDLDKGQHYLGWLFFRQAPLLQWPLGANPGYGMDLGSSVVYSDSVPLFALLFKPFRAVLPAGFQYFGLWLLTCFLLQALFAYKLLEHLTRAPRLALVGTGFFLIAPPLLARCFIHLALCAHWVLLAGLYLYLTNGSARRWVLLLAVTSLIHGYLLVMVGAIWLAHLVRRGVSGELKAAALAGQATAGLATTVALMWLAGYFMLNGSLSAIPVGYGGCRMNLLSPLNPELRPDQVYSQLLPALPGAWGDYEGFNFLGVGMLGLWCAALVGMALRRPKVAVSRAAILPLLLVVFVPATAAALSNNPAVGGREIHLFDLPPRLMAIGDTFRASGRLFWPAFYLLYLAPFYLLSRRLPGMAAVLMAGCLLAIQAADSRGVIAQLRRANAAAYTAPTRSAFWQMAGRHYRQLLVVLPDGNFGTGQELLRMYDLGRFAALHGMTMNAGYLARVDPRRRTEARRRLAASIEAGRFSPRALYVFREDGALWRLAVSRAGPDDAYGLADGFLVFAPGLRTRPAGLQRRRPGADYALGTTLSFADPVVRRRYLADGWAWESEWMGWGLWADGDTASLGVTLAARPAQALALTIRAGAPICPVQRRQQVAVLVNGSPVGTLHYSSPAATSATFTIPRSAAARDGGRLLVTFRFDPHRKRLADLRLSPAQQRALALVSPYQDLTNDGRRLGLRLVSLAVSAAPR